VSRKKQTNIGILKQELVEYERNKAWVIVAGIHFSKIKINEVKRDKRMVNNVRTHAEGPVPVAERSKAMVCDRSPARHGCLSVVSVVCCQVEVYATS
jgi:hypothetical protein